MTLRAAIIGVGQIGMLLEGGEMMRCRYQDGG